LGDFVRKLRIMGREKKDDDRRRDSYRMIAQYSSIIFLLPSSLLVGYLIGRFLDGYFETFPWLTMVFLLLGGAAGFVQVFRILNRK
jgi:ATP synthase protein I